MPTATRTLRHQATTHSLQAIPGGDAGTRKTLYVMRDLVREWRIHPQLRDLAKRLVRRCAALPRPKAYGCQAARLHAWVRDQVGYMRDVAGVETVQAPDKTLADGNGDCDDQVVLLGSLMQSIGIPVRIVAVGFRDRGPFSHVYLECKVGAYWRPCETTERWKIGKRPPGVRRHMVLKV